MKVVHALHDSYHNRHVVASRKPAQARKRTTRREKRLASKRARPSRAGGHPRIPAHRTIQVPRVHDDDAQAHRSRTLPRKGSCDVAKANTTERRATLLATSLSMTLETSPVSFTSTKQFKVSRERSDSAASRVTAFST